MSFEYIALQGLSLNVALLSLVVYLTTLSVTLPLWRLMVERLGNDESERIWKEIIVACSRNFSEISPGTVNITTKNLGIADNSDKTRTINDHSMFSANDG
jgi:hypothetical protein